MYLKNKSPRISNAKIKEGAFVGPQRELIQDTRFDDWLSEVEKSSMEIIQKCHHQFFQKSKTEKYHDMVADLVQSYEVMGVICL